MKRFFQVLLVLTGSIILGCQTSNHSRQSIKPVQEEESSNSEKPLQDAGQADKLSSSLEIRPPVIIYKTRKDYSQFVPVVLSEDGKSLVSFPDIRDILTEDGFTYPETLADGYLLDRRGIAKGAAFLDLTYEEYGKLLVTPSANFLMEHLLDTDPLTNLYICNCQYDSILINEMIRNGAFENCLKVK